MKYKYLWLSFLFILQVTVSFAQDLRSTVIRILDHQYLPVQGAIIQVNETKETTTTNINGNAELQVDPQQNYLIVIQYNNQTTHENLRLPSKKQYTFYITTNSTQLDEITVYGTRKFAEKKSDFVARMPLENLKNSQTYTVIPQELLKEQSITDINGALMTAPGLANVTSGVGSGGYRYEARIRGFSTSSSTLKDGLYLNTYSIADLANVESIEILKGPTGTLFGGIGTSSYGGLINIATKKPKPYKFREINYSFGAYNLNRVAIDFNNPLNESQTALFRLNGSIHYNGTSQDYGKTKRFFMAPSFRFLVTDRLTLDIEMEYGKTEQNITALGLPVGISKFKDYNWDIKKSYTANELASTNDVFNVIAKANYQFSENWKSTTTVANAKAENLGNYLFLVPQTDPNLIGRRIMRIPNTFTSFTVRQDFIGVQKSNWFTNTLLVGLDYNQSKNLNYRTMANFYDIVNKNDIAPMINIDKVNTLLAAQTPQSFDMSTKTYGAYISDVFSISDQLHLNAGLRYEQYKDVQKDFSESNFSPKFGLVYEVIKDEISLYGNYLNTYKNGYKQDETSFFSEFTVKPESANQYEFGAKYELLQKKLHGNISYYHIQVDDIMRQVTDANGKLGINQDGTLRSRGFEADLTANPIAGWHIIVGYGYNDSKFIKGDSKKINKKPEGVPYNVANFWTSYRFSSGMLHGIGIGVGGNYSDTFYGNDDNTIKMDSYFIANASIFYEKNKLRIGIKANNFTNKTYYTTNFWVYPQEKRTVIGNVSYQF